MPPYHNPVKVYHETYNLLLKIQDNLPGKPTLVSLLKEAVELLSEKHLPTNKKEENG